MGVLYAFMLIIIGGFINGSFALPTKHIRNWHFEHIWLAFAGWTFVIIPWVAAMFLSPQILSVYRQAPGHIVAVMLIGGLTYGVGFSCFAVALDTIGLGLAFVVNLGIGIMLGFLLPLVIQHPGEILTPFGIMTLLGCVLAVVGLMFFDHAGSSRYKNNNQKRRDRFKEKTYLTGLIAAVIAGVCSGGQNFCFSYTSQLQQFALHMGATQIGAATIMWPGFLLSAFVPYAIYMLYLSKRNNSLKLYVAGNAGRYYILTLFMGVFWYGSLILYSKASQLIGVLGPLVGWPLFMVMIIMAAIFWSWRYKEWQDSDKQVQNYLWTGLICLVFAILVLTYSSYFHT